MSKKLDKLVNINGLREFKNKLVGTDSAYVQTGAVDQTIGGTKTFSKPIVGSVTGSSGSCTGNAATANIATKATQDSDGNKITTTYSKNGHTHDDRYYTENEVNNLLNGKANTSGTYSNLTVGNAGSATNATYANWLRTSSHTDHLFHTEWDGRGYFWTYVTAGDGGYRAVRVARSDSSGNADTATKAVSADSAINAGHATSADKATKAEQDGNGNNIVASYVAAGSEDSTTDIGAFMSARPSFIKSFVYNNVWTDAISMRHRNGSGDGSSYGTYIRSSDMTGISNLLWNHQYAAGTWQGERTLIDSANLAGFVKSGITIYDLVPDGAEAHNAMWGGRDITAAFDSGEFSEHVADGTFKDIFPGDYITKQVTIGGTAYTVNWVIADCDYWINKGDTAMTAHHVVIVPQQPLYLARMNGSNTTEGGYEGSAMYKITLSYFAKGIVSAFGSDHILTFRDSITRAVNASSISSGAPFWTGASSDWGWYDAQCNLMCERMVYGMPAFSSSGWDAGVATRQLSAFRLSEKLINPNRQAWWLRDVVSFAHFAYVAGNGSANADSASYVFGVRPFALLR